MEETSFERRMRVFGDIPVSEMSATTRKYFKKVNHRKQEIISYERKKKR